MRLKRQFWCAIVLMVIQESSAAPHFFLRRFYKNRQSPEGTTYTFKFVPLINLLVGVFPKFTSRFGQFAGVNKMATSENAGTLRRNYTDTAIEYEQTELNELTECDEFHLGFWPDLSDDQTYYKCEIDQIAIATRDCIRDYFRLKLESETAVLPSAEKAEIPGTKPCFSLSIMKCANGFKYSHKMKVCVPDIVYGSEFSLQTKNP